MDYREAVETARREALREEVRHRWSAFDYCILPVPHPILAAAVLPAAFQCHTLPVMMFYLTLCLEPSAHLNNQSGPSSLVFRRFILTMKG